MAKGKYILDGLTSEEHRAALAAVKLVRGDSIKNAYLEGFKDGFVESSNRYSGRQTDGALKCWEESQAFALSRSKDKQS